MIAVIGDQFGAYRGYPVNGRHGAVTPSQNNSRYRPRLAWRCL